MKTVRKEKAQAPNYSFPCLMRHPVTGVVILATKHTERGFTGMVIYSDSAAFDPGDYATDWGNAFEPSPDTFEVSND